MITGEMLSQRVKFGEWPPVDYSELGGVGEPPHQETNPIDSDRSKQAASADFRTSWNRF